MLILFGAAVRLFAFLQLALFFPHAIQHKADDKGDHHGDHSADAGVDQVGHAVTADVSGQDQQAGRAGSVAEISG